MKDIPLKREVRFEPGTTCNNVFNVSTQSCL